MGKRKVHILSDKQDITNYTIETWDSDDASPKTKELAKYFGKSEGWITFKDEIRLATLLQLTKWFDTEFGILACPGSVDNSLILKQGKPGDEGLGGMVSAKGAPQGSRFLLHTHPTHKSYRHHLALDIKNSPDWEAIVDLDLTVVAYCGVDIANIKNNDGSYKSLECTLPNWPVFLTHNPRTNVCVSPELFWKNYQTLAKEKRINDFLYRCAEFLAVGNTTEGEKCYKAAEQLELKAFWSADQQRINEAIGELRDYNTSTKERKYVGAGNAYRSASQTMWSFGVYLR